WIFWSDAKARAFEVYEKIVGEHRAPEFAERLILRELGTGKIPWDCSYREGQDQHLIGRPEFFHNRRLTPGPSPAVRLYHVRVDLDKNWATRPGPGLIVYGGKLGKEAFIKLLPVVDVDDNGVATVTKVWITRKARELKRTGRIDPFIKKTKFAK